MEYRMTIDSERTWTSLSPRPARGPVHVHSSILSLQIEQ
jgi:hypothetical protein